MASSRNRVMRARLARALRLAPTLLAVCPAALAAQTIDTILVVRHNVYDRKRDAPKVVASVGNALHITTLGWVVRHALLIKRGDTYDSAKVAESERALRALTIFRAVSIDTERVDGGRRTALAGQYKAISDGDSGSWSLGVPFYETVAPRSLVTNGAAGKERVLQFRDGVLADSVQHRLLLFGLSGGVALRATRASYARLWFSASWRREDFALATTVPFPRSQFGTVGAGMELKQVRFQVLENFNAFAHQEDVDLSQILRLGVWAAPRAWGYKPDSAGVGPEASGQLSAIWHNGFAVVRGQADGVLTGAGVDSGRVFGSMTVASQNLARQTLIFHLEGGALRGPKPG